MKDQPNSRSRFRGILTLAAASLIAFEGGGGGVVEAYSNPPLLGSLANKASQMSGEEEGNGKSAHPPPKLVLIAGAPGTGKSTFGMSVALDQGILKCVSTDTVRAVMRSFVPPAVSPALHRSSYAPAYYRDDDDDDDDGDDFSFKDTPAADDDPVRCWRETCSVLRRSVESLIDEAIEMNDGRGLVLEGVHVVPGIDLIRKWEDAGGVAVGCLLQVSDPEAHRAALKRGGYIDDECDDDVSVGGGSGKKKKKKKKKNSAYARVRAIQDEMMHLADLAGWVRIEQQTEPGPLDLVKGRLTSTAGTPLAENEPTPEEDREMEAEAEALPPTLPLDALLGSKAARMDITEDILRAAKTPMIEHFPHLASMGKSTIPMVDRFTAPRKKVSRLADKSKKSRVRSAMSKPPTGAATKIHRKRLRN